MSDWLGKRFGNAPFEVRPLSRTPQLLARAEAFVKRYGALSVFSGRFFGPLRAIVPLVAGIVRMPSLAFWLANTCSSIILAPALLLPGAMAGFVSEAVSVGHERKPLVAIGIGIVILVVLWSARRHELYKLFWRLWRK